MVEDNNTKMQVSGKALAPMPKFIQKKFGKEGLNNWMDAISAEAHQVFFFPIKLNDWFPLRETLIEPCANIAQLFYNWDLKSASWELGRFSADYSLKNVSKLFIKLGNTQTLINKASEFLSSYYQPSEIKVIESTDKSGKFRINKFPEIDKAIEYRIAGWVQRTLEINGCKNINIDITKSLTNFHPFSEFHITWE